MHLTMIGYVTRRLDTDKTELCLLCIQFAIFHFGVTPCGGVTRCGPHPPHPSSDASGHVQDKLAIRSELGHELLEQECFQLFSELRDGIRLFQSCRQTVPNLRSSDREGSRGHLSFNQRHVKIVHVAVCSTGAVVV